MPAIENIPRLNLFLSFEFDEILSDRFEIITQNVFKERYTDKYFDVVGEEAKDKCLVAILRHGLIVLQNMRFSFTVGLDFLCKRRTIYRTVSMTSIFSVRGEHILV